MAGQHHEVGLLLLVLCINLAQVGQYLSDVCRGYVIGLQVARVTGQQIATLAGFGVQHVLQQLVDGAARLLRGDDVFTGTHGPDVTCFIEGHKGQGRQHRQGQADGHFGNSQPAHHGFPLV